MDLNKVMLIGRLTRDPEARTTPQGQAVTTFSVATGLRWKDATGNVQEKTEFHNVVAWRKLAETCAQYLKKASRIYVEGRLQTRSWDDPQGQKKYRTEIVLDNMIMLDSKGASGNAPTPFPSATPAPAVAAPMPPADDEIRVEDIPF